MRSAIGTVGGMVQEKGSRERCSSWTVTCTMHQCAVFWVFYFAR